MRRFLTLAVTAFVGLMIAGIGGSASTPVTAPTRQDIAKRILDSNAVLTAPARAFLEMVARGDRRLGSDLTSNDSSIASKAAAGLKSALKAAAGAPARDEGEGMTNVRVNNPAEDVNQTDQTTQSETSIAVSGKNVAVGFNDSQTSLLAFTAATNLSGFAYSRDGGNSFVDGGALPNAPADMNFGDPWLASDSGGNMYYSELLVSSNQGSLFVGTSKSTDGGKTWSMPNPVPPPASAPQFGYSADKDALASGPGVGNLYDSWDDFTFTADAFGNFTVFSGLPVAHSTDGGATWSTIYADQVVLSSFNPTTGTSSDCSSLQYIGAQPVAAPDGVTVYDAALRFGVSDPGCTHQQPFTENEWVLISHDGGNTFPEKVKIADVLPSTGPFFGGAFQLGPGQFMRNLELPTVALRNGTLYASWNDGSVLAAAAASGAKPLGGGPPPPPPGGGGGSGHSHIAFSRSTDGGQTWSTPVGVTSGSNDEAQPAITADRSGIHDLYYEITPSPGNDGTRVLDVVVSNSDDGGASWEATRVTSQSFPGVFTLPQFEPFIAPAYMGDYIANVSAGGIQYFAWGDNRDVVTNFLWPSGRHDPDVFFASSE